MKKYSNLVDPDAHTKEVMVTTRWRLLFKHMVHLRCDPIVYEYHYKLVDQITISYRVTEVPVPFRRAIINNNLGLRQEDLD